MIVIETIVISTQRCLHSIFMTQGSNMKEKICQMYMDEAKSGYFKQLYPSYSYTRSKIYLDNGCKNVKLAFKEIE